MKKHLVWGKHTFIMGILNLTPDSFSGDGLLAGKDAVQQALRQARQMAAEGAEILDLGAESSRPGAEPVSMELEMQRLMPALEVIREQEPDILLSVDTYKSEVASRALQAGADWINDIWGLRFDPQMAAVIAQNKAGVVLMHNGRALSGASETNPSNRPKDVVEWVREGLEESLNIARQAGIGKEDILLDVGIGFGKTLAENLELINRLNEFKSLGYPLLIGPSRKSFIGATLNLPADQRVEGTAAATAISITRGADIIRVHDVREMTRVARMCDALLATKGSRSC
jgi:dihydropteroate synthase